jgi:hypothetical protein
MKRHLGGLLFIVATLAPVASAASDSTRASARTMHTEERGRLRDASDPNLGSLRAGRELDTKPIQDSERSTLRSAEAQSRELGDMRGGADTLTVLLIVVVVLLIIVLI